MKQQKGKGLERTIRLIQETLKDSPHTIIYNNYQIDSQTNRRREIDILIVSQLNDFTIKIAIECKDYKRRVPVKEVEAFNSKCILIPEINKKVFVSSNGYQSGAIASADKFGIELLIAKELNVDIILSWFPINKLDMQYITPFGAANLFVDSEDEKYIARTLAQFDETIYFNDSNPPLKLGQLIANLANFNKEIFWKLGLTRYLQTKSEERLNVIDIPIKIGFNAVYIKDCNNNKLSLTGLSLVVKMRFSESPANIIEAKLLQGLDGNVKANAIKVDIGSNQIGDIILSKDKINIYVSDIYGEPIQLDHLFKIEGPANNRTY